MTSTDTVTIPRAVYEAMREHIEDLDDILAAHEANTGPALPHDFAMRIIAGDHPVRVWRDYRGLTASALADAAGVSKTYLSEIETGKKPGSLDFYRAVARALDVSVDVVLP